MHQSEHRALGCCSHGGELKRTFREEAGQREDRGEHVAEENLRSVRTKGAFRQCKKRIKTPVKWAEHKRKEENNIYIFSFLPA